MPCPLRVRSSWTLSRGDALSGSYRLELFQSYRRPVFVRRTARAIGIAKLTLAFTIRIAPALSQLTAFSPPFSLLLLFYKVVDCNAARICVDGQDLPPVANDHKIQVRIGCR